MTSTSSDGFRELPTEILDQILSLLDRRSLLRFSEAAKWCHELTLPLIWREIELVDCITPAHKKNDCDVPEDLHDDSPIIRKLLIIVNNPQIARYVKIVNHRCHLPPPVNDELLLYETFKGQTLSYDPRLIRLVRLAANRLLNVHTLRVIHGHQRLTEALVRSFFDRSRIHAMPVRRLWLESCDLSNALLPELTRHKHDLAKEVDFTGLVSLRLRKLSLHVYNEDHAPYPTNLDFNLRRRPAEEHGIFHRTDQHPSYAHDEWEIGGSAYSVPLDESTLRSRINDHYRVPNNFDDSVFEELSRIVELPREVQQANIASHEDRALWAYHVERPVSSEAREEESGIEWNEYSRDLRAIFQDETPSPAACVLDLLRSCRETLTSLNLDWIVNGTKAQPDEQYPRDPTLDHIHKMRKVWHLDVFRLRFPHLRAFQLRDFTTDYNALPPHLYLLDCCHSASCYEQVAAPERHDHICNDGWAPLSFLEAHPDLQCLAWPSDRFFNPDLSSKPTSRVQKVIDNLAIHLKDLRVDTERYHMAEPHTDPNDTPLRKRRRRFIEHFASCMVTIENIKVSGGVPLDERREILRAVYRCPLQRISLIGLSSSIGNTWAQHRVDPSLLGFNPNDVSSREEDRGAIWRLGSRAPSKPSDGFVPAYGWIGAAPMITTIAGCFSETLRELKLCGFIGAPILLKPRPITGPMLAGLQYMDHLEVLIMSLYIETVFQETPFDAEIIELWNSTWDPSTTALAVIDQTTAERGTWQERIMALEPSSLAKKVTALFGPHLSDRAKHKGVHVRASFAVGDESNYDLDTLIGKDKDGKDTCLNFVGPREDLDRDRRKEKLDTRRWF